MNKLFQRRGCIQITFALACLGWFSSVNAASVSLTPATQVVSVGDPVALNLLMDFSDDPTSGGGVDISFDKNVIESASFVFDTPLGLDPGFTGWEKPGAGVVTVYFGNFQGLAGPAKVGTLSFSAIGVGTTDLVLRDSTKWGSFFSAQTFQPISTQYNNSASVQVVPLPASIWMLIAGFASLAGFLRRA